MKQIIRRWMLAAGMMLLHTQMILAQQPTELSNEDFNVEGWMFIGAGIAICIAVILLFFLNKLFTRECIKKEEKKVPKTKQQTKPVKPIAQAKQAKVTQQAKKENKVATKAEKVPATNKRPVTPQKLAEPVKRAAGGSAMDSLKSKLPRQEMPLEKSTEAVQLELTEESDASKIITLHLNDQVTLGRNPEKCSVVIADDLAVSGMHCKIYIFEGKIYVMDLGSTNGTYVNGKKIQYAVVLKVGDYLEIGSREYRISW